MNHKPLYNEAWQASVSLRGKRPPSYSSFEGVTARIFPLKADLRRLQAFCQKYYDIGPSNIVQLQPVFPYVQLMILHYGQMRPEGSREWISQHEIAFVIPLEWRRQEKGRSVFVDWVYATPFIFVDDDISLMFGREVYGWPKIAAKVEKAIEPWTTHPRAPTQLMTVSTAGYFSPSARKQEKLEKLLDITLAPSPLAFQLRPEPNPLRAVFDGPQSLFDYMATIWNSFGDWTSGGALGSSFLFDWQAQTQLLLTMVRRAGAAWADVSREMLVDALFPGVSQRPLAQKLGGQACSSSAPPLNQMNVKQFRDAADPSRACYQALVNSQIKILRLENAGLLGESQLLYGDPSGGFALHLYAKAESNTVSDGHENTGEIILRELGLEVAEQRRVREGRHERIVSTLKPLYPFWTQMALQYGDAETLCWRAHSEQWQSHTQAPPATAADPPHFRSAMKRPLSWADDAGPVHSEGKIDEGFRAEVTAEEAEGSAYRALGEREGNAVLLNVYPLQADQQKLVDFCHLYFNNLNFSQNNLGLSQPPFTPLGSQVYFVTLSTQARVKGWLLREVGFYVPVLWPTSQGVTAAAISAPFLYSESDIDAIVDRELNGRATQDASLEFPRKGQAEFGVLDSAQPIPLLTVRTEVFASKNAGEADKAGRLLQLAAIPGQARRNTLDLNGVATALANGSLKSLAVKQFPDAEDLQCACYQALVAATWAMEGNVTIRKIEGERILRLYTLGYPKIAETLGLISLEDAHPRKDEPFSTFPISNPFSVEIEKQAGWRNQKNIYWRAGSLEWQVGATDS